MTARKKKRPQPFCEEETTKAFLVSTVTNINTILEFWKRIKYILPFK